MENLDQTQLLLLLVAVAAFAFLLGRQSAGFESPVDQAERDMRKQQMAEEAFSALSPTIQQEVDGLITEGEMIAAIKIVRTNSGLGLREAKILVDHRRHLLKGT